MADGELPSAQQGPSPGSSNEGDSSSSSAPEQQGQPGKKPRGEGLRVKFSLARRARSGSNDHASSADDEAPQAEPVVPSRPSPTLKHPLNEKRPSTVADGVSSELSSDNDADLRSQVARALQSTVLQEQDEDDYEKHQSRIKEDSQLSAQQRARRLETLLGSSSSAPASRRNSDDNDTLVTASPTGKPPNNLSPMSNDSIPMLDLQGRNPNDYAPLVEEDAPVSSRKRSTSTTEAHRLVRRFTRRELNNIPDSRPNTPPPGLVSGQVTPEAEKDPLDYVSRPVRTRGGVLSSLLKLYGQQGNGSSIRSQSPASTGTITPPMPSHLSPRFGAMSTPNSGTSTPRHRQKWYDKPSSQSVSSIAGLVNASTVMASSAAGPSFAGAAKKPQRPRLGPRSRSGGIIGAAAHKFKPRLEDEIRITVHIAAILSRQRYLLKLCHALMAYGAPTHRLEEYLRMSARVLEIDGQFLYIPGCMIISFDDTSTHTTEVKIVRTAQGVDLGKLNDVHEIYKEVVHDVIDVEEATQRLDEVVKRKNKYNIWVLLFFHGLASASVGPWAFGTRPIDLPVAFLLGIVLGTLQLVVSPRSDLYSNIFEISASVFTSFLARAFGSIPYGDGRMFCFSGLAQSSIAMILPGYTILCGSLELQSKNIVAGSVRMIYAIMYALFLGFGITIGTIVYGLMDGNATSATSCPTSPLAPYINFVFVPVFTLCLAIINQSRLSQVPIMLLVSCSGYLTNYFSSKRFGSNSPVASALGAFVIGVIANLYSRLRHGVAAAALLPAIFVQVPSGLAASGSLLSGITTADQIVGNSTTHATKYTTSSSTAIWTVGAGMVQVAIGITVGLFLSAVVVYPLGKRRSGLFSF